MIIGKGNNNFNNPLNDDNKFKTKMDNIKNASTLNKYNDGLVDDVNSPKFNNPLDKDQMSDKTLSMLHDRLSKGLITLEEFNKKCNELGKKRNKNI
jgi:hypothetical protein